MWEMQALPSCWKERELGVVVSLTGVAQTFIQLLESIGLVIKTLHMLLPVSYVFFPLTPAHYLIFLFR